MSDDENAKSTKAVEAEHEEEIYFAFSATLRIFGDISDPASITKHLGLAPTHQHRKGDRCRPSAAPSRFDLWMFEVPVPEERPLHEHLEALRAAIGANAGYLKNLRQSGLTVDVFCGYRSNCDHAGFEVDYRALELFAELETPFSVSVIII